MEERVRVEDHPLELRLTKVMSRDCHQEAGGDEQPVVVIEAEAVVVIDVEEEQRDPVLSEVVVMSMKNCASYEKIITR